MAIIKISSGLKSQDALIASNSLFLKMPDGTRRTYKVKDAIDKIEKISEDKKKVLFDLSLRDGIKFRGESTNSVFHEFAKYAGTSSNPIFYKETSAKKAKFENAVSGLFICMITLAVLYSCVSNSNKSDPKVVTADAMKSGAYAYCVGVVKRNLKAPKSADFPWGVEVVQTVDGKYVVQSYVDSQNSFGALIRTRYRCELSNAGSDDYNSWTVEDLKIFE